MNPEPRAAVFLSFGVPNSLNISSNGDPGGNWKGNGLEFVTTVCVVDILTTDGINLSARSANDSGTVLEFDKDKLLNVNNSTRSIVLICFMLTFNIINNYKSQDCKY